MALWDRVKSFGSRRRDAVPKSDKSNDAGHHRGHTEPGGGWIPLALETPILFGFMFFSLLLFAATETLAQRSQAQKGLAISPSYDDIPQYAMISYLYGPNIVAALYGLIWNWIDLDIKRMQPWFELSKGATAKDSIHLDYPSDFFAVAPIRAARRKHWTVFFSATTLVLIMLVLTPLQNSLLGVKVIAQNQSAIITTRSSFLPTSQQSISTKAFNEAYGIAALNLSYPVFTTDTYALLPFYVNEDTIKSGSEANWTAETTKVWSEFSCTPATYNITNSTWQSTGLLYSDYTFYGKDNCTVTRTYVGQGPKFTPLPGVGGAEDDLYVDYLPCPTNSNTSYSAMVMWAKEIKRKADADDKEWKMNVTGVTCELSYHKQQVTATVTSQGQVPIENAMKPLEEPQDLGLEEFDFNKLTSTLPIQWSYSISSNALDFSGSSFPLLDYMFDGWNITIPFPIIVSYALARGNANATRDDYADPRRLGGIFQSLQQQIFALSVAELLTNNTVASNDTATVTSYMTGIIVSRQLSAVSEAFLLLVAIMVASILYFLRSSECALLRNPSSIGRLLDIGHTSPDVVKLFHAMDTTDEKRLNQSLADAKFKLIVNPLSKENELVVLQDHITPDAPLPKNTPGYYAPLKPWAFKRRAGAFFTIILIASIAVLFTFKAREAKLNGLPRPSQNFEVLQILENYIPTIFATLIGPIWIYLTRTLCIFQPFQDLWAGRSPAANSIEATYTSLPPQLVLFRAIKSRHIMLVLLCSISLLGDVLGVGLGALFNEKPIEAKYQQEFQPISQDQFNYSAISNYKDYWRQKFGTPYPNYHNYIVMANLTFHSPLPPWTTPDWYFLPYSIPETDGDTSNMQYVIQTRGYGAKINCTWTPTCSLSLTNVTTTNNTRTVKYTSIDNTGKHYLEWDSNANSTFKGDSACSGFRSNIGTGLATWLSSSIDKPAQLTINDGGSMGWLRRSPETSQNNTVNATFAVCSTMFETANFSVTIDQEGHILGYSRVSDIKTTIDSPGSTPDKNPRLVFGDTLSSFYASVGTWSYTNRTTDWMSQFIFSETGSRSLIDPTAPVPDLVEVIPSIKKIYKLVVTAFLSRNPQFFLELDETTTSAIGKRAVKETRIFMDNPAFYISISILFINLIVILAFYIRPIRYILPRMPTTIGSVLAYLAPSRAIRDGTPSSGWKDQTFSFGRYIGYDGSSHIGIEMDPHVLQKDLSLGLHKTLLSREKSRHNEI